MPNYSIKWSANGGPPGPVWRYAVEQGLAPACALDTLPQRSVAFCSTETLVAPDAHLTHLYADGVHLTTAGHRLVAQEALRAIRH